METVNGPGLPTLTYTPDGEGRVNALTASSGPNPLNSTSYNVFGEATGVTYGSGDSDSFQYDANTGRMTQYQFNVNGQSVAGNLTWNANGTLGKLVIADALHSANDQTCRYGYDDLARLASTGCDAFSQTFTPDVFGNLTKSGTLSFQPSYNLSTNQISRLGGQTATYDKNGNLAYDTYNNYTWDWQGHMVSKQNIILGGAARTVTYDALGRWVEESTNPSVQEVYGPTGGKLSLMLGQTLAEAKVPLAGGGRVFYCASGVCDYSHPDWLGTIRLESTPGRGVDTDSNYAPFGETYASEPPSGGENIFTGQYQEIGAPDMFDFPAREYHPTQGRWISPDPGGLSAVDLTNPQSLNRYAYALNNPTTLIDPSGLNPFSEDPGGVQCRDATFAESHAQCQGPGSPWCFVFPTDAGCIYTPPISGGGGGAGGGGAGGTTTGGALPGRGIGSSGVDVGNAFLGFHLACSQTKLSVPGLPGGSVSPANCVLFFLNIRLNAYSVATDLTAAGLVIAGSVTVIVPVAGGAGVGPTFPFAFGTQGFGCLGAGGAFGTVGKAVNAGPIIGGDLGNCRNVLSGLSISVNAQSVSPLAGAQVIQNSSGLLYGPTFGTPGFSASASYSFCGTTP